MEIMQINDIRVIITNDRLIKITIGTYKGAWVQKNDTQILKSDKRCLKTEAYLIEGNYYHMMEFERNEIVYDHHYNNHTFMDKCHYGFVSRNVEGYFHEDAEHEYFEDTYYINASVMNSHNIYYCADCEVTYNQVNSECGCDTECDNYNDEDEDENHTDNDVREYNFCYHSNNREDHSNNSIYKIGFEVEKEDVAQCKQGYARDLFEATGWAKEHDGSLGTGGYELVSPVFPLNIDKKVSTQWKLNSSIDNVANYINASYSKACGGHINISKQGLDSYALLTRISGYIPLFYALYENRLENHFSQAKKLSTYINNSDKYGAFHCKLNGVLEIRIFPAVKDVSNLLWRTELIRLILKYETTNYKCALGYINSPNSELNQHLRKIFSTEKLMRKAKLFAHYAQYYERVSIDKKIINRSLSKLMVA